MKIQSVVSAANKQERLCWPYERWIFYRD